MTYHSVEIGQLSHSQKLKLRKGLPVRVKIGKHHIIDISTDQYKKLQSAHKKGKAYTLTMDPHQAQMHGQGLMGDIFKQLQKGLQQGLNFVKRNKLQGVVNPLINLGKKGLHTGLNLAHAETGVASPFLNPLVKYGHNQIDNIPDIGQGFGMDMLKALGPHVLDFAAQQAKNKLAGRGARGSKPQGHGHGHGGALFPAGYGLHGAHKIPRKHKQKKGKGAIGNILAGVLGQLLPF